MALTIDDVRKVASLARLRLDPKDERAMARELGTVLEYIDLLKDYDPPSPPATEAPVEDLDGDNPWVVDDYPRRCLPRDLLLANAPAVVEGQFSVPAILAPEKRKGSDEEEARDD
jgi:aspartyl-tRNA(Asn)/glutamyl-tRNA(Gln) amidotransferase subunit C